jgi:chromosome segregation ATPase
MSELNIQVVKLQEESQDIKENAFDKARAELRMELHTKDIEIRQKDAKIRHCQETIDELKQQMSSTQPERKGEAGEQDLLEELREAFPDDQFCRQTRGISEVKLLTSIGYRQPPN